MGMYFLDEQDEKEARELERQLKRKAYRYARKANRLKGKPNAKYDEYSQRANELFLSMRDIRDMRDNEKMAFHFEEYKSESQQQNGLETPETQITDTDTKGNPIVVMFSERGNGNIIHEVKHGGQYARGEMERIEEVEREIQAYRAQWAWKGVLSYMSECNLRQSRLVWDIYKEQGYAIFDKSLLRTIYKVNDINSAMVNDIIEINNDKEFWGLYPERIIR